MCPVRAEISIGGHGDDAVWVDTHEVVLVGREIHGLVEGDREILGKPLVDTPSE